MTRKRLYVTVTGVPKVREIQWLDPKRLTQAMEDSQQFTNDSQLAKFLDTSKQVGRWRTAQTTPAGNKVELMCFILAASPAYLFGRTQEEIFDFYVRSVGREMSPPLGAIVDLLKDVSPELQEKALASLQVWLSRQQYSRPFEPWERDEKSNASTLDENELEPESPRQESVVDSDPAPTSKRLK